MVTERKAESVWLLQWPTGFREIWITDTNGREYHFDITESTEIDSDWKEEWAIE